MKSSKTHRLWHWTLSNVPPSIMRAESLATIEEFHKTWLLTELWGTTNDDFSGQFFCIFKIIFFALLLLYVT